VGCYALSIGKYLSKLQRNMCKSLPSRRDVAVGTSYFTKSFFLIIWWHVIELLPLNMSASLSLSSHITVFMNDATFSSFNKLNTETYVYWTVHHLESWIKIDYLDVTCFIISLFNTQHVSDVSTSILRSLWLICWVISCVVLVWFDVCWCYGVVRLGWCGIRMQAEALQHIFWPATPF
jgi:hypothetical protein